MTEKLTYKDFLINHYNLILKGIVRADVGMMMIEKTPVSVDDVNVISVRTKEISDLRSFVMGQREELKVVEGMLTKCKDS